MQDPLVERWDRVIAPFGADEGLLSPAFADVIERYREPQRHYHTVEHLHDVVTAIDLLDPDAAPAVVLAGFLHDVVYDPTRHDNEAVSAAYAIELLARLGVVASTASEVARLIELTAGHEVADDDRNGRLLADADLSILGADPDRYDRYARDIRLEYAHVPDDLYRDGRSAVVRGFLERPRLFATAAAHDAWDGPARRNLRRELDRLATDAKKVNP